MLGNTHELRLAAETELDMNGHSQTVGTLNGSADSLLSLNGGSLTVTNGGTSTYFAVNGERRAEYSGRHAGHRGR